MEPIGRPEGVGGLNGMLEVMPGAAGLLPVNVGALLPSGADEVEPDKF